MGTIQMKGGILLKHQKWGDRLPRRSDLKHIFAKLHLKGRKHIEKRLEGVRTSSIVHCH